MTYFPRQIQGSGIFGRGSVGVLADDVAATIAESILAEVAAENPGELVRVQVIENPGDRYFGEYGEYTTPPRRETITLTPYVAGAPRASRSYVIGVLAPFPRQVQGSGKFSRGSVGILAGDIPATLAESILAEIAAEFPDDLVRGKVLSPGDDYYGEDGGYAALTGQRLVTITPFITGVPIGNRSYVLGASSPLATLDRKTHMSAGV